MGWKKLALALYPKPWAMAELGSGSAVMLPRRVQGARHIHVGRDVIIQAHGWLAAFERWGVQVFSPRIDIGDHTRIGRHAIITAVEAVSIGEGCLLSEQVFISDHVHQTLPGPVPPTRQPLVPAGPVHIGRHCFLGIRTVVMGGVTLGDCCVVGANSVVTHSFPAGSVIAGAPARLLRTQPVSATPPGAGAGAGDVA